MAKAKPNAQPWSGEEAPKEEAQTDTPAEGEGEGAEEEGDEGEESADETETEEEGKGEEDPAAEPKSEKEPEVSAAIKPPKKTKKNEGLTGDGIKAHGKLQEGDHLPNEVINRVSQGVKLVDAIAEYNEKQAQKQEINKKGMTA